jgi:hypothetical protein
MSGASARDERAVIEEQAHWLSAPSVARWLQLRRTRRHQRIENPLRCTPDF